MMGLVLNAGGARAAYQAGVLKYISEISPLKQATSPFSIISGASAGALNGSFIAMGSENFYFTVQQLSDLWSQIQFHQVFRTDFESLGGLSLGFIRDLIIGGHLPLRGRTHSFLDFNPLKKFIESHLKVELIEKALRKKSLYAVAISATSYYSGTSYTFIHGQQGHPIWQKSRRIAISKPLDANLIWASCSIPVVFQPVQITLPTGDYFFGDGSLRLIHPCSPAIRLGADFIFAIGIRSKKAAEEKSKNEFFTHPFSTDQSYRMPMPALAQIFGVILNSIFLDHLDSDLEHLQRMNDLLNQSSLNKKATSLIEPMRQVKALALHPSIDLASIAEPFHKKIPKFIRHVIDSLSESQTQSADLMSYLLFDQCYTKRLLEVGYYDAQAKKEEIKDFLEQAHIASP